MGVQLFERLFGGDRLVCPYPVVIMQYLAVQVRPVRRIKVADANIPDAGNSKVDRDGNRGPRARDKSGILILRLPPQPSII
jgi:hypothetical protein